MKKLAPLFLASLFAFASCGKKKAEEPKAEQQTEAAAQSVVSEIESKISELKEIVAKITPLLEKIKGGDATVAGEVESLSKQATEIDNFLKGQTLSDEQKATIEQIMSALK